MAQIAAPDHIGWDIPWGPEMYLLRSLCSSRVWPPRGPECSPDNIGWDIPWGPEKVPPARCHMMGGTGGPRASSLRPWAAPALFPHHMCFARMKFRCWVLTSLPLSHDVLAFHAQPKALPRQVPGKDTSLYSCEMSKSEITLASYISL